MLISYSGKDVRDSIYLFVSACWTHWILCTKGLPKSHGKAELNDNAHFFLELFEDFLYLYVQSWETFFLISCFNALHKKTGITKQIQLGGSGNERRRIGMVLSSFLQAEINFSHRKSEMVSAVTLRQSVSDTSAFSDSSHGVVSRLLTTLESSWTRLHSGVECSNYHLICCF